MVKYFCDKCGKQTPLTCLVDVTMKSKSKTDGQFFNAVVCEKCADAVVNAIIGDPKSKSATETK